jgi:hypothetical protein
MSRKDKIQKYLGIFLFGINVKERIYTGLRFNEANQNRVLASDISDFMKENRRVFVSRNGDLYIEWGDSFARVIFEFFRIFLITSFLLDKLRIDLYWIVLINLLWNVINLIIQYKNEETIRYLIRSLNRNIDNEIILIKVSLTSFLNIRFNCDDEEMFVESITSTIRYLIEILWDYKSYSNTESWQEVLDILSNNSINYSHRIEKIISLIQKEDLLKTDYYEGNYLSQYNQNVNKYQKIIGKYSNRIL